MNPGSVWAVFRFEVAQFRKVSRVLWWLGLTIFPLAILTVIRMNSPGIGTMSDEELFMTVALIFTLSGGVVCLLALLLSASQVVHTEIERRTWAYVASRPRGRGSFIVGQYLAAVLWSATAAWVAMTGGLVLLNVTPFFEIWLRLTGILLASTCAYGALYTVIGVLFLKRGLTIAVVYTLIVEVVLALVPAVVAQGTIQFRVRSLVIDALQLEDLPQLDLMISTTPAWADVAILAGIAVVLMTASVVILNGRELVTADE